jgi:hypothetical protein
VRIAAFPLPVAFDRGLRAVALRERRLDLPSDATSGRRWCRDPLFRPVLETAGSSIASVECPIDLAAYPGRSADDEATSDAFVVFGIW